ncbi:hypothetical protein Dret_1209 [Desulfohalobium retbaense DSM 5692]|uniref:Uncharacterized protein n=1 Tax=Desulfohalobium retbaense (strain ATCC 49708 / DSM 5692 / JCM 16813 / HR100) TaxID=485915 RepID=C8X1S5_DESRD|nr:hypothetical protein Dret_1209 [Desulfohalobium retbaense DSM 5692]
MLQTLRGKKDWRNVEQLRGTEKLQARGKGSSTSEKHDHQIEIGIDSRSSDSRYRVCIIGYQERVSGSTLPSVY